MQNKIISIFSILSGRFGVALSFTFSGLCIGFARSSPADTFVYLLLGSVAFSILGQFMLNNMTERIWLEFSKFAEQSTKKEDKSNGL